MPPFFQRNLHTNFHFSNEIYRLSSTFPKSRASRNQVSYAKTFSFIDAEYKKSTEDFIKHFKNTYSDPYAPAWMISEIIPFGTTVQLYKNLADQRIRKQIARQFHLQPQALESWVTTLALTRNACCHHARVWNKVNLIIPADAKQMSRPWLTIPVAKDRIYFNICIIKFFLDIISPSNDFKNKLHTLFSKFPLSFDSINSIKLWFFLRTSKFLYKIEKFMNL